MPRFSRLKLLAAERDAATADAAATKARSAELEATSTRLAGEVEMLGRDRDEAAKRIAELEPWFEEARSARARVVELESTQADLVRARDESASRIAGLERQLDELQSAAGRVVELEATTTLAEVERAVLTRARDDAARRSSELEQQLVEVGDRAAARTAELDAELASVREEAARVVATHDTELAAAQARVAELEASAASAGSEIAMLQRAREEAAEKHAQLEAAREESARFQMERTALAQAHEEAVSRVAALEQQLAELRTAAESEDGHLAAATARVVELEATVADAAEKLARMREERGAFDAAQESLSTRNSHLEARLERLEAERENVTRLEQQVEEAAAQIAQLEAERNDVLAVAKAVGEERRGRHPDDHAEDPAHLLFVPGAEGYRLLEQEGPPPAPGSTLKFGENDGSTSRLLVARLGRAPVPGTRLACAYLVAQ